jgi:hypothetical protein
MSKKQSKPTIETKPIVHVRSTVQTVFGYVEDGNVVDLPAVGFTVSRINEESMAEFLVAFEEQRALKSKEVNVSAPPQE